MGNRRAYPEEPCETLSNRSYGSESPELQGHAASLSITSSQFCFFARDIIPQACLFTALLSRLSVVRHKRGGTISRDSWFTSSPNLAICAGEKSGFKTAITFLRTLAGSREEKSTSPVGFASAA
jgi:hypothetical protein